MSRARTTRRRPRESEWATICITESTGGFDPSVVTTSSVTPSWRVGQQEEVGASVNFATVLGSGEKRVLLGPRRTLSSLQRLYLYNNQLTGSIPAELGNLSLLLDLRLYSNQLTGSIPAELGNLSSLNYLYLNNNQLTGSIPAELGNLSSLQRLYLNSNQLTGVEAGALAGLVATVLIQLQDTGLTQAAVDAVIDEIYTARASYTYATPALNIGGTNAAPSGIYQDAAPPTTGKEKIFKLVNDSNGEGFNTWTITYTA